ncbi:MAG: hypothetical protein R3C39_01555 [Dehalococcoidia bacterium]
MKNGWRYGLMAAAAAGALLVACSGDDSDSSSGDTTSTVESTATVQDATPSGTFATNTAEATSTETAAATEAATTEATPSETAMAAAQVSANNASREELTAAFEAAGISNADKWAREVEEYRPYPEDDAGMAKLRDELAKYNPADGVVDSIVATLSLP